MSELQEVEECVCDFYYFDQNKKKPICDECKYIEILGLIDKSELKKIENIPEYVDKFDCWDNKITKIENLPKLLKEFDCSNNQIKVIENLPNLLEIFWCHDNIISKIEKLPESLYEFVCSDNSIEKIENLPNSLYNFDCSDNVVEKIENLPNSLEIFNCDNNLIRRIENLPNSLKEFRFDNNLIEFVNNMTWREYISLFEDFEIEEYTCIKKSQQIIKNWYKPEEAARVITRNCHNWIWKPFCNDGTIGIRPRLDTRDLGL
jgi:hypothetical protein